MKLEISDLARSSLSPVFFENILHTIAQYVKIKKKIGLVIAPPKIMKQLNKQLRTKVYVPMVLALPAGFSDDEYIGEVYLLFRKNILQKEIAFNFIHGVLHLAGYDHDTDKNVKLMEDLEKKILSRSGF